MPDKSKHLYHVKKLTSVYHFFIPPFVSLDIFAITRGEGHQGISCCYKIITYSWFIYSLTKLLCSFIYNCPQYLALETRQYPPYRSLHPIEPPLLLIFILTLDFILAFPLTKMKFNAIMLMTYKFSKRIILVEGANTWSAEQWAYAFLKRLDLIDWGLLGELITDRNSKLLNKFWNALFTKLWVKLLYRTAYYPQTDGSSERTNQTIKMALQFFVYVIEDPSH